MLKENDRRFIRKLIREILKRKLPTELKQTLNLKHKAQRKTFRRKLGKYLKRLLISQLEKQIQIGHGENTESSEIELVKTKERNLKKWGATETSFYFKLNEATFEKNESIEDFQKTIYNALDLIWKTVKDKVAAHDRVRMILNSSSLEKKFSTFLVPAADFSIELLMTAIVNALQSNESIATDKNVEVTIQTIELPKGGYRPTHLHVGYHNARSNLKSIVQVHASDNLCLPAAILLGALRLKNGAQDSQFKKLAHKRNHAQLTSKAKELYQTVMNEEHDGRMCSIKDIKKFQDYFNDMQIVVFTWQGGKKLLFKGDDHKNKIFIVHHAHHFDLITKVIGFLSKDYFCNRCYKGHNSEQKHRCLHKCKSCLRQNCSGIDETMKLHCNNCNRYFKDQSCFKAHLQKLSKSGRALCDKMKNCKECGLQYTVNSRKKQNHVCNAIYCYNCRTDVSREHLCYLRPVGNNDCDSDNTAPNLEEELIMEKESKDDPLEYLASTNFKPTPSEKDVDEFKNAQYTYFDFECLVDDSNSFKHIPNLIVAQTNTTPMEEFKHFGTDCVDKFCKWAIRKERKFTTYISHNRQKYDNYFILNWILENSSYIPKTVITGGSLLEIGVPQLNIRFIDSLNFIKTALSNLPKVFGFENQFAKGFFPHKFNTEQNYDYVGQIPEKEQFDFKWMSHERRKEFDEWYPTQFDKEWNFKQQIDFYCTLDTQILRLCCEKFREIFFNASAVDPFTCITIASACSMVFRKNFLVPNTIGIVPPNGYIGHDVQSKQARKWLEYESYEKNVEIVHAGNGHEIKVKGRKYKLDGVRKNPDGTLSNFGYEYLGCYIHGCLKCYRRDQLNSLIQKPMAEVYNNTMFRLNWLKNNGWRLKVIWACEFEKLLKENDEAKQFVESLNISSPLNPREAFFGGRTNAARLYYEAKNGEIIKYADINSLYPWVNKTQRYPLGHPKILTGGAIDMKNIRKYFGLIKAEVLPPRKLFHPVLPKRCRNKLMFVLCNECGENPPLDKICRHNEMQRKLKGTWASVELFAALDVGYKLVSVSEVWHFEKTSSNLFKQYVDTFLAMKHQAKGLPQSLQDF